MAVKERQDMPRRRAPSKRSLETRARILDTAERLFARGGFDGTSMREIAAEAGVPVALVNFHGGAKEALFFTVIARRAEELSAARLDALETLKASNEAPVLDDILDCFVRPYLAKAATGGPQWPAYARLVAHVSADARWRAISEACFDPTAELFVDAMWSAFPDANRHDVAAGFVFTVAAMLSLVTSLWRVDALAGGPSDDGAPRLDARATFLVAYAAAGMRAVLGHSQPTR